MSKVIAVIQARMGSTRLPGKVLMPLDDHPVLEWCVRACRAAPGIDAVWVATSTLAADDKIANWCDDMEFPCWRGSETDVLSRFVGCANVSGADVILRITGDEPFIDPQVIGAVVRLQKQTDAPFCTNVSPRTYPDGLDVQAMTRFALLAAHAAATRPLDRDGVCTWIERNRSRFPAETVINPIPGLQNERWVLDTEADYEFCRAVAHYWPWEKGPPTQLDILNVLDRHPQLRDLNANHVCNERYIDALAEEPIYERKFKRSQAQFERARKVIPLAAQTFSKSHLQYPQPSPLFLSHGQGGLCWDVDGNEYVDLVSALLPTVLGARDPHVDAAVRKQLASGISFSLATEFEAQLAETLVRLIPCAEMVRFGKTGTDATSAAIRLARAYRRCDDVIISGYHGWADWSVANSNDLGVPGAVRELTFPIKPEDYETLQLAHRDFTTHAADKLAAIIVDCSTATPKWLQACADTARATGAVLIFDEVITGFRYDLGGAQKLYSITPDLACFGKAMANGMPLSAVVGRREIMKRMEPPNNIFYSGTFFGETLSLAASIATITKLEREEILPKLAKAGAELARCVSWLAPKYHITHDIFSLIGHPTFTRLKFRDDKIATLFRREMIASGTLITNSHNICAAHGPSDMKRVHASYDHAFAVLRDALDKDDIDQRLGNAKVATGVR